MPGMSTDAPQGAVPAATFGEELRKEREIRGISLKEIADSTKISKRFLELIEKNDFRSLPAPVFTRGFVREYARYLGLNSDEMVSRYVHFVESNPPGEEPTPSRPRPLPVRTLRVTPEPARGVWVVPVLIALVVGLIVLAFFLYFRGRGVLGGPTAAPAAVMPGAPARSRLPVPPSTQNPIAAEPVSNQMTMKLTATDKVWVTLAVDGETVINEVLNPGAQREFKADREFRFKTIGNAAGVSLSFNGNPLPPLGAAGEVVRNRVFNRGNLSAASPPSVDQG